MQSLRFKFIIFLLAQFPMLGMGQYAYGEFSYPPTELPKDTCQLWIAEGDPQSDTVILISQGGPEKYLFIETEGRTIWRYIAGYQHYYTAYVHQAQTWNPLIFDYQDTISVPMVEKEAKHSTEMLHRSISYFKQRNKYVIVIGHSFGAFILSYYLANYPSIADKYIISAGRISVNEEMVQDHLKGLNGWFDEDGLSYHPYDPAEDQDPYATPRSNRMYRVKQLLKGAFGQPPYIELFSKVDLSNLIFYHGTRDENVGNLLPKELEFLKEKGVQLIKVEGGHYQVPRKVIDDFSGIR